ncbi:hypothetical protein K443DRAFT_40279, partial [Laccaria amethystina LaAM-08-1]
STLPSPGYSIWNPWNEGLYLPRVIPWTSWIPSGMMMEWSWNSHGFDWIPYGMGAYPPWIPWN